MGAGVDALREVALAHPQARALLLDGHARGQHGGSGERFDWGVSVELVPQPLILAGGLNPQNVGDAIARLRPFAVDVSSGIEQAPGQKDSGKMADFLRATRAADGARH
jgi:phosphoribosylanthranilate isomerase